MLTPKTLAPNIGVMSYTNNPAFDAAMDTWERERHDREEPEVPRCCECGHPVGREYAYNLTTDRYSCADHDATKERTESIVAAAFELMMEAARKVKAKHPTMTGLEVWALLAAGDKDKSAMAGDVVNAIADEDGL